MNKEVRQSNTGSPQVKVIRKHSLRLTIFYAIALILVLWWLLSLFSSWYAWKAVFLSNNQVFFGKFIDIPFSSKIVLKKVHYIKSDVPSENASGVGEGRDIVIVPLGDMLHGPKSTRVILKEHILYYEQLRPDTTLVKGLNEGAAE